MTVHASTPGSNLMKVAVLLYAALMTLAPRLTAQQSNSHPEVAGVWRMDTTRFEKHDPELTGLTLKVAHYGDTLVIVTDVDDLGRPPFSFVSRYLPDHLAGTSTGDNSPRLNHLAWEGDTLVLRSVENRPERTLKIEERWTIDASGRTLSRLQTVLDGERRSRQTLVFTRQ